MSNQYKYNDDQNKDSKINRIQNYKKCNGNNIKIHDQIMKPIINNLKILIIFLIICNLLNLCSGEVEPKLNYDDLTTVMTKSHIFVGGNGAAAINDLNSINHNNLNKNNNNNNEHFMNGSTESSSTITNLGFIHAFIASISVILVSELGDKTFFIAAIMAMKYPRLTVFIGAMSALALMTVLSAVFGMAATIIPRVYTYYISTALFAIFGIKMLKEGYYMSPSNAQEELEEVQSDIRKREDELVKKSKRRRRDSDNDNNSTITTTHKKNSNDNNTSDDSDHNNNDDNIDDRINGNNNINIDDKIINNNDNDNNHHNRIKSTTSSASSIASNYKTDAGSSCTMATTNSHGTIILHNNKTIATTSQTDEIKSKLRIKNNNYSASGIELKQLNKGGECKNRLEKEVTATLVQDPESGVIRKTKQRSAAYLASRIFMQAFTMTFLAEWGDRSQLTTIILSAREDVYGVIVGGVLGHSLCTGLAVLGGRIIAQRISVRTVTLVGGVVFLLFAISALFFNPNEEKP